MTNCFVPFLSTAYNRAVALLPAILAGEFNAVIMEYLLVRKKCANCNRDGLMTRIKRPLLVKYLLFWLPLKHYKCNYCDNKNYIFGSIFKRAGLYKFDEADYIGKKNFVS